MNTIDYYNNSRYLKTFYIDNINNNIWMKFKDYYFFKKRYKNTKNKKWLIK